MNNLRYNIPIENITNFRRKRKMDEEMLIKQIRKLVTYLSVKQMEKVIDYMAFIITYDC